ncbi:MAG TPA: chromate resistance protein ChrB domain-containing protein [Patescibacteria group bacterium]|nr:chromate resistance protein ChrB domain-containing protein [Patescibacteria group bacterium]
MSDATEAHWLVLIHQIPPKPDYFRVKVGRRLQRLGAVAIKNSVYVLPKSAGTLEDFQWLLREIDEEGGDASICEARFVDGLSDEQIHALFHEVRRADYAEISEAARRISKTLPVSGVIEESLRGQAESDLARLGRRFTEVSAIDFFNAPGRESAAGLIAGLQSRLRPAPAADGPARRPRPAERYSGRTWVTRKGIHVDRMASGWLIRRFIDKDARFKFVAGRDYSPRPGELRFDMFDAEFTHEGDHCTFEVLLARFSIKDPGLSAIAEIVHDVDLKDAKFSRPEAPGFERLVAGISLARKDDTARLERACAMLDDLYEYYRRKPETRRTP